MENKEISIEQLSKNYIAVKDKIYDLFKENIESKKETMISISTDGGLDGEKYKRIVKNHFNKDIDLISKNPKEPLKAGISDIDFNVSERKIEIKFKNIPMPFLEKKEPSIRINEANKTTFKNMVQEYANLYLAIKRAKEASENEIKKINLEEGMERSEALKNSHNRPLGI